MAPQITDVRPSRMENDAKVLCWEVFVSPDIERIWDDENRVQWIRNKDPSSERYAVRVAQDRAQDTDKIVSVRATRDDGWVWEKWRYYPNEVG